MHRLMFKAATFMAMMTIAAGAQADWVKQFSLAGDGNGMYGVAAWDENIAASGGKQNQGQGDQPAVWFTANGGKAWTNGSLPGQFSMVFRLDFADSKTAYGAGLGLFKSVDGGQSWSNVTVPGISAFDGVMDVFAVNSSYVYAISGNKVIYTSNGLNFQVTNTGAGQEFASIFFIDNLNGWVVGGLKEEITETDPESGMDVVVGYNIKNEGIVMRSEDGGRGWAPLVIGAPEYFNSIAMLTENIGLATATSQTKPYYFKRTTDGGTSWTDIDLPAPPKADQEWVFLTKPVWLSPVHAIAGGSVGYEDGGYGNRAVVVESYDGGVSWEFVPGAEQNGGYFDIAFPCEHVGWLVGDWGIIVQFSDGMGCDGIVDPGGDNDGDVISGDSVGEPDVWTWGKVFGTFGDEQLISENSAPGNTDAWGGVIPGDDVGGGCQEVTKSTSCSASSLPASSSAGWMLLAVLITLGFLRLKRARNLAGLMVVVVGLSTGCGKEETVMVCEDVAPAPEPDVADDSGGDVVVQPEEFICQLAADQEPENFAGTTQRKANVDNRIVFVREAAEGGSDLFLISPKGGQPKQLTRFGDPNVEVKFPAWSPNRDYIAFFSNYRAQFNEMKYNLFVVAVDGSKCYQITPDPLAARRYDPADETLTVNGSFKFGSGAIANPITGATVCHEGGATCATTTGGGQFTIKVPSGKGRLVLRGIVNTMSVVGVAEYDGTAPGPLDIGAVVGKSEENMEVGPINWTPAGSTSYVFVKQALAQLLTVHMNTGEMAAAFARDEDMVTAFAHFPTGDKALVAFGSDPATVSIYPLSKQDDSDYDIPWEGQTAESHVAVSPLYFLASLQGDKVVLMGADAAGEVAVKDVSPDSGLSGLVQDQFDWSLDATHLVLTVQGASGTNLVVLDVNAKKVSVLTTDGKSSQPAWFGR